MDSWKSHLKFGIVFMLPFIIGMYFWKGWYNVMLIQDSIPKVIFLIQILILLFVSPIILDIDHKQGKIREGLTFVGLIIALIGAIGYLMGIELISIMVMGVFLASGSYLLFYVTVHRGFVHSIPSCLIYGGIVFLLLYNIEFAILAVLGSYTHLIADKIPIKVV